jgi:hypothetical protein
MQTVNTILAALTSYRIASEILCDVDSSDAKAWQNAWRMMEAAQNDLIAAVPSPYREILISGERYGTDLPGDPSCYSPDEVSEFCAILAIWSLQ